MPATYGLDNEHWEVLKWHWRGEGSFNLVTYPETPALLNLIARRIPKQIRSDALYSAMTRDLRAKLAAAPKPEPIALFKPQRRPFWRKAGPALALDDWFAACGT
jgi:hypothetical protein